MRSFLLVAQFHTYTASSVVLAITIVVTVVVVVVVIRNRLASSGDAALLGQAAGDTAGDTVPVAAEGSCHQSTAKGRVSCGVNLLEVKDFRDNSSRLNGKRGLLCTADGVGLPDET